ncbi:hypothetical protein [Salipiger abyssi]|uniref:Uncharacterized protein n=1 Tax=Salipiger abyssi TaxID=1250539 RepID=A0A1P8UXL9_9RHOB|nr:hypothetical protein [Salipiger abyssi]ALF02110.1 hypothetical protein vBPeaSP1_019 [Pelagibaca phage vB_PeaS-P1]APZ54125.1 hypothetical protein Ga0080574_TMP3791 [Salipiger abyssi]
MKLALRPSPDFFDLPAWEARLEELRAEPQDAAGREAAISHAETMVELLSEPGRKSPGEAA